MQATCHNCGCKLQLEKSERLAYCVSCAQMVFDEMGYPVGDGTSFDVALGGDPGTMTLYPNRVIASTKPETIN